MINQAMFPFTAIILVTHNVAKSFMATLIAIIWILLAGMATPTAAAPLIQQIGATLSHPWGMDFLDDQHLFVTERGGNLYLVNLLTGERDTIANVPTVQAKRQGGMLDVAVHQNPDDDSVTVYLCYSLLIGDKTVTAIDKAKFGGIDLTDRQTIFKANNQEISAIHYGCRLAIDQRYLYASLGDRGNRHDAQNPSLHGGAVIRLLHDGTPAPNNPNLQGWAPEILSKGHRNPQGLAINPETGELWAHEHGPRGGDEINIINAGHNYGWPKVSHGKEYLGGSIGSGTSAPGLTDPVWVWTPSIAPSGMAFYKGDMFPFLNGHLLVGSLKFKRLYLVILENGLPARETVMMDGAIGRVRDVAIAYDGSVLLLSDEEEGGLYRIALAGK